MPTDHYRALGVRPDAGPQELRAAYLRVMRDNHPDRRPGDPVAADTARRANVAYQVLRDTARARGQAGAARPDLRRSEALRAAAHARRAYSDRQRAYRRAFSRACFRVGAAIVMVGMALLLGVV